MSIVMEDSVEHDVCGTGIERYSPPDNQYMGSLEARKKSFSQYGWDENIPVSVTKLAEAGFYYFGIPFL